MTFPVVRDSAAGVSSGDATSHSVALPATVVAGDILLAFFSNDGTATVTWDNATAGTWTLGHSDVRTTLNRLTVYWKRADGTEGGKTLTITTSAAEQAVYRVVGISGAHETTNPAFGTAANATSANPNPPLLTPSWGAENTLWFAYHGNDDGRRSQSAVPANYTNGFYDSSNGPAGCGLGTARRELNATSDDPGTFTISASQGWVSNTAAIRPAPAGIIATLMQTDATDTVAATASAPVAATLAATDATDALTGAGVAPIAATLAQTDATDTLVADGGAPIIVCTLAVTDATDGLTGVAVAPVGASLAQTDATDAAAASATAPVAGQLAATDATDAVASTAALAVAGQLSATDATDTVAAAATVAVVATLAVTDAADTLAATGDAQSPGINATLAVTDATDGVTASGTVPVAASLAATDAADAIAASGAVTTPGANATLAVTDDDDSIAAQGAVLIAGIVSASDGQDGITALGAVVIEAALAATDETDALAASGVAANETVATLSVTDETDVLVASALFTTRLVSSLTRFGGTAERSRPTAPTRKRNGPPSNQRPG